MRQMTALLWKEWRELRLTFTVLALLNVPIAAGFGLFGVKEYGVAMLYYCVAVAWLLGAAAAGGEQVTGRCGFITANPVHLRLLWLSKLVVGLCCTLVLIVFSYVSMWCVCPAHEFASIEALSLSVLALYFFCLSHYHACWVRSAITAMGLGLLSGVALQALRRLTPLGTGPTWGLVLGVAALAVLLTLASRQFVRAVRLGGQLDRRRRIVWFLLPILLIGALPLVLLAPVCGIRVPWSAARPAIDRGVEIGAEQEQQNR